MRGQRVILAADLAKIYGVHTRALNQAVKRNRARFPEDFTFQLTRDEAGRIAVSRSQSVISKRGRNIKYLPYVFTEHGALMAANILNSAHAVRMSVFVVRAFVSCVIRLNCEKMQWPNWRNWNAPSPCTRFTVPKQYTGTGKREDWHRPRVLHKMPIGGRSFYEDPG